MQKTYEFRYVYPAKRRRKDNQSVQAHETEASARAKAEESARRLDGGGRMELRISRPAISSRRTEDPAFDVDAYLLLENGQRRATFENGEWK